MKKKTVKPRSTVGKRIAAASPADRLPLLYKPSEREHHADRPAVKLVEAWASYRKSVQQAVKPDAVAYVDDDGPVTWRESLEEQLSEARELLRVVVENALLTGDSEPFRQIADEMDWRKRQSQPDEIKVAILRAARVGKVSFYKVAKELVGSDSPQFEATKKRIARLAKTLGLKPAK